MLGWQDALTAKWAFLPWGRPIGQWDIHAARGKTWPVGRTYVHTSVFRSTKASPSSSGRLSRAEKANHPVYGIWNGVVKAAGPLQPQCYIYPAK